MCQKYLITLQHQKYLITVNYSNISQKYLITVKKFNYSQKYLITVNGYATHYSAANKNKKERETVFTVIKNKHFAYFV